MQDGTQDLSSGDGKASADFEAFIRALVERGGEMGRAIARRDWSRTALGDLRGWPQSLRTLATTILMSPAPLVLLWGPEGVMLYNDAYAAFVGPRHARLLGGRVREVWPEVAAFSARLLQTGLSGEALRYRDQEARIDRGGGAAPVWLNLDYSPVLGEDGRPAGVLGIVVETTEQVLAARALEAERYRLGESEARFRNMAEQAPVMLWVTDAEGGCVYLNRSWRDFTGQTTSEGLGFGWLQATHPDDRSQAEAVFRDALSRRSAFRIDYRLRRADGVYRWCIDAAAPRLSDAGEFLGYVGSVIDIEERQEAEQRLRTITNTLPAFVWFGTPDGALQYFNDRWFEYTGQTPDAAMAGGWIDVLHPDDQTRVAAAWAEAREAERSYVIECRYRRRDGAYRWYLARAEPLRNAAGHVTGWVGSSSDIHDRVTAEDHQRFLLNELNHRVKNTLSTVQALAAQTAAADRSHAEFLQMFESRLLSLSAAHDLLTASNWAGASLAEVVNRVTRPWSAGRDLTVAGPGVWLSPRQALSIAMALHELSTNALKYGSLSAPTGRVDITWTVREGRLAIEWRELGGPPVSAPRRRGFGSRLLERGIGRELGGATTLTFAPGGVAFRLETPLGQEVGP